MKNIIIQDLDKGNAFLINLKDVKHSLKILQFTKLLGYFELIFSESNHVVVGHYDGLSIKTDGEYTEAITFTLFDVWTSQGFFNCDCVEKLSRNRNGF